MYGRPMPTAVAPSASAMISSVYLLVKRSRLWLYGVMFCFYYMFVLVWQLPIAVLTFAEGACHA